MESYPQILDATAHHREALIDLFSDSFANDPILNWVIPMPSLYPGFFRLIIEGVFEPKGIMHLEQQERGASLWLPPHEQFDMPLRLGLISMILKLVGRKGLAPLLRIQKQGEFFARHHPSEPHYYLQFIGARQRSQGQGVGSALLKHGTRLCDEQHMPAYLESSNSLNVPLYQRHGFEVQTEAKIPGGGPSVWFMWREPR